MTPDAVKANFEARSHAASELQALYTEAAGRELTAEERSTEEKLSAAISEFDARIASGLDAMKNEKAADEARSEFEGVLPKGEQRDAGNPELEAFLKGEIRSIEFRASNAKLDGPRGGNTVPTDMYGEIVRHAVESNTVMAANAKVLSTSTGTAIQVPTSSTYPTATLEGETDEIAASNPTFGQVTLNAYKYAFLAQVSSELLTDSAFDIEGYLAEVGGEAIGRGTGAAFISGDGSDKPNGLFNGAEVAVTAASATAIAFDDLIDLQHSVATAYRANGVFIMNDATLKAIRKIKDLEGRYIWAPATTVGQPDTILGSPVFTDPAVPVIGSTNASVAFGDLSRGYIVRLAQGVRVERSDDFAFDHDLVTWRFIARVDGEVVDTNAVKLLIH